MNKFAFTLAEVLITLGIIGIVAALTLPALIQTNKNLEVEAKLKKFYSIMNQAIMLSELKNGDYNYWPAPCGNTTCEEYLAKYYKPYFTTIKLTKFNSYGGNNVAYYFNDGTAVVFKAEGGKFDIFFFPNAKNLDPDNFAETNDDGSVASRQGSGISYFTFQTIPPNDESGHTMKRFRNKKFSPYIHDLRCWSEACLTDPGNTWACHKDAPLKGWCTALIFYHGWKIPKDYPFKVR